MIPVPSVFTFPVIVILAAVPSHAALADAPQVELTRGEGKVDIAIGGAASRDILL